MTYSEKLKDPRWQKKRLKILERDNWTCVYCDDKEKTLHIHHEKYSGEPWETNDDDLKTCCSVCHTTITFMTKNNQWNQKFLHIYKEEIISPKYRCFVLSEDSSLKLITFLNIVDENPYECEQHCYFILNSFMDGIDFIKSKLN